MTDTVEPHTPDGHERRGRPRGLVPLLGLADLEAVRLLLRGGSVVDWYRLNFSSDEEARSFFRRLEGDPDDPRDLDRMGRLRDQAAHYLANSMGYRLPEDLLVCPPFELFVFASERRGRRRDRFYACLLLKAMHILLHIEARELRFLLPLSESAIANLLTEKVAAFVDELRREGFPLARYEGGEKSLESLVTKLLVKKEHHAAAIHDRVRFRFVVERAADLVPLLHLMTKRLLPFSYVVPGQTVNHLVNFTALVESHAAYREHQQDFQVEIGHEEQLAQQLNEFSGPSYRVINFIVDVPIRVPDEVLAHAGVAGELGRVIFNLAEFQVVDERSEVENQAGDNRHDRYKERQLAMVRERLERGLRGMRLDDDVVNLGDGRSSYSAHDAKD